MEMTTPKFKQYDTVNIVGLNKTATILTEYSESQRRATNHDYLIILKDGTEVEALESQLEAV